MNYQKNYTIIATLGDDLERIIEANFLDDDDLAIVYQRLKLLFDAHDACWTKIDSMSTKERNYYELNGGEMIFPYPYFILDNKKHRDLICFLTLADIGIILSIDDVPNLFERIDTINLLP